MIAPVAPHLAEELYEHAGNDGSVFLRDWTPLSDIERVDIEPLVELRSALLAELAGAGVKSAADVDVALAVEEGVDYPGEAASSCRTCSASVGWGAAGC